MAFTSALVAQSPWLVAAALAACEPWRRAPRPPVLRVVNWRRFSGEPSVLWLYVGDDLHKLTALLTGAARAAWPEREEHFLDGAWIRLRDFEVVLDARPLGRRHASPFRAGPTFVLLIRALETIDSTGIYHGPRVDVMDVPRVRGALRRLLSGPGPPGPRRLADVPAASLWSRAPRSPPAASPPAAQQGPSDEASPTPPATQQGLSDEDAADERRPIA